MSVVAGKSVVPVWVWPAWIALIAWCALLAADRVSALGHRVHNGWLVIRAGSVEHAATASRPRALSAGPCGSRRFSAARGSPPLVAAAAAGVKRYPLIDVPEDWSGRLRPRRRRGWPPVSGRSAKERRSACAPPRCGPQAVRWWPLPPVGRRRVDAIRCESNRAACQFGSAPLLPTR